MAFTPKPKRLRAIGGRHKGVSPVIAGQKDRYVDALLQGLPPIRAARYAGINPTAKSMQNLLMDPYVVDRLKTLREALDAEDIVTKNEVLLNLKSIATDTEKRDSDRIAATKTIVDIMGFTAPTKTANLHLIQGGVMLVPVSGSTVDWEAAAKQAQDDLKNEVRK